MPWPDIELTAARIEINTAPLTVIDLTSPWCGTTDEGYLELSLGPDLAGENVRVAGDYDFPVRKTPVTTRRSFPLFVSGEVDRNGDPVADPEAQAWSNLRHLRAHVFDPPALADRPDGTRVVTLTDPDGTSMFRGDAHFYQPTIAEYVPPFGIFLVVDLDIVNGYLMPYTPPSP